MRKVLKFVKGRKEGQREGGGASGGGTMTPSQSRDLSSPAQTPEDERFIGLDNSSGYIVDFCGKDKTLTKLHKAAWQGHLEKLKAALKKVEIDAVDRHNRSALHFAVARGHPNIVWYLLGNDAKMTITDDDGCTPLLKAIECGHKDCTNLLLERGADVDNADYQGNTGLHIAARQGTLDLASALVSRGAALDVPNNCGEYPLHIATRSQNKDLVELLLRSRASVNVFDRENRTPLMLAAKTGNLLLAHLFFEYGAHLDVVDSNGWTAEDYALLNGHQAVADELKSYHSAKSEADAKLDTHAEEDESEAGKSEAGGGGGDSGTWNDDPPTSSDSKKEKVRKRMKHLLEEKDEEDEEMSESEAMPPPCRPPRSWDMIQAGMIDANHQDGSESKRLSITTLGTLRTRRESFTEASNNGSNQGGETARYTLSLNRRRPVKRENSFAKQRLSFNEEESLKSWMSDTSSTLKEIEKMDLEKLRKISGKGSDWDSDVGTSVALPSTRKDDSAVNASDSGASQRSQSQHRQQEEQKNQEESTCSESRSEAFNGIDEIWVSNARTARESSCSKAETDQSSWDSDEVNCAEAEEVGFPPPPSGIELGVNMARSIRCSKGMSIDHPMERPSWKTECQHNQARSFDCLEDEREKESIAAAADAERGLREHTGSRRHMRHRSVSAPKWRSEEIPQENRLIDVNRRINEQLQCYDQALRELAETPYAKKESAKDAHNYHSLPTSKHKAGERRTCGGDEYYRDWSKPFADARSSGPLSLPFAVNDAENNERLGSEGSGESEQRKSKRHMLLAMRDVKHAVHVANTFKTSVDDQILSPLAKPPDSSDDSDGEESPGTRARRREEHREEQQPQQHFFKSDLTLGGRQETVIERAEYRRKSSSSGTGEEPTLWLQDGRKRWSRKNSEEEVAEIEEGEKMAGPSRGESEGMKNGELSVNVSNDRRDDEDGVAGGGDVGGVSPDVSFSSGPIDPIGAGKDSGSEAESTHNEVSPTHNYTLQTHHEWLKNHLKTTTTEKNKLEQVAVELSEKAERLQYELADAKEATKGKDEVIALLQSQLARMETAYTKSLEESVQSRLQLTTHEQEILHLKELCFKYEEEKERSGSDDRDDEDRSELRSRIRVLEEEKEKMKRDILRLEQEKGSLEKRLQEATTTEILDQCQRWKERFDNLESTKASEESRSAYLDYVKTLGEEHRERETKLAARIAQLEKEVLDARREATHLEGRLRSESGQSLHMMEVCGSVSEMANRSREMESQVKRLEREVEERRAEREGEVKALAKEFAAEREALVRTYEARLAEERERERREAEEVKEVVKRLREEMESVRGRSVLEEANEALGREVTRLRDECDRLSETVTRAETRGKEEADALARENLHLKKEVNELKVKLVAEDGERPDFRKDLLSVVSDHATAKSEVIQLKSQMREMEGTLASERKLLEEYKEKNAGLEEHIAKLAAESDGKQSSRGQQETNRGGRKRGAGKEDELAWSNLYGMKRAGKGREGSISLEDFFVRGEVGANGEGRTALARSETLVAEQDYARAREDVRHRLESRYRSEEEKRGRETDQACEVLELRRQILVLRDGMAEEKGRRLAAERRLAEAEAEAADKRRLEAEVEALKRRIDRQQILLPLGRGIASGEATGERVRVARERAEDEREGDEMGRYKAECERFAREMERSKEIRRRVEEPPPAGGKDVRPAEAVRSVFVQQDAPQTVPTTAIHLSSAELEPETKQRLNEELEKSIKKHMTDGSIRADAGT